MNRIKFSYEYRKLLGANYSSVILLEVIVVNLDGLSKHFIGYDTDSVYKLPAKGEYLLLIFDKNFNPSPAKNIFTTLRRWTGHKEEYYRSKIGQQFQIEILTPQSHSEIKS
jgi:hypothetical protein